MHEAELRGCCRKVPAVPEWIIAGQSRIFLVHRGGHTRRDRGSIFGYFVVHRAEYIVADAVHDELRSGTKLPWIPAVHRAVMSAVRKGFAKPGPLPGSHRPELEEAVRRHFEKNWNRNFRKQLGRREGVTFRPRGSRQSPGPSHPIDDVQELVEDLLEECIEDFVEDVAQKWYQDLQKEAADRERATVPVSVSCCETHRYCSKRLKAGSAYLVDALTAGITDAFLKELDGRRPPTREGEDIFRRVVAAAGQKRRGRPSARLDPRLEGHAELRGELVLFARPYPVFRRAPQAAFRGLLRIDGNRLLEQICECYRKGQPLCAPRIPYC